MSYGGGLGMHKKDSTGETVLELRLDINISIDLKIERLGADIHGRA